MSLLAQLNIVFSFPGCGKAGPGIFFSQKFLP